MVHLNANGGLSEGSVGLTEPHLRRLSVTMRALEDALFDIETALAERAERSMTIYEDDVPGSIHVLIREQLARLRREIGAVKEHYRLEPQIVSNRRLISVKLSLLSIDLTEATSRYMRGFGEVPADEQGPLDNRIMKLISILDELNAILTAV
jgi:hypothetical protein